jgi:ParB/RepB/Spo0J family partition protein
MEAEVTERTTKVGTAKPGRASIRIQQIAVERIRPEEGLGRKRDRDGHRELCRSIEQFGVLTPITVRRAPDNSEEYLLIKGQGRTLACRLLGLTKIPAVVADDQIADTEKVQQFLVENVARLRMHPVDRALLIAHARQEGEETAQVAMRFGVSFSTVRRLEAQLDGATSGEVSALRANNLTLSVHAVITRHVVPRDRADVIGAVGPSGIRARELEELFSAIGWSDLVELGPNHHAQRLRLLSWACDTLMSLPRSQTKERFRQLALQLPLSLVADDQIREAVGR